MFVVNYMYSRSLMNFKIVVSHNFSLDTSVKENPFTFRCFSYPAGRHKGTPSVDSVWLHQFHSRCFGSYVRCRGFRNLWSWIETIVWWNLMKKRNLMLNNTFIPEGSSRERVELKGKVVLTKEIFNLRLFLWTWFSLALWLSDVTENIENSL